MAPLERLKILMQVQGNEKQYTGVVQVGAGPGVLECWARGGGLAGVGVSFERRRRHGHASRRSAQPPPLPPSPPSATLAGHGSDVPQ